MEPVYVDLGEFVPEEYSFGFKINGTAYRFAYAEATVDEVFRLLWAAAQEGGDNITVARGVVTQFLQKVCVEGDKEQLAKDMALLPYTSKRGGLDITTLYATIQSRVKKKEPGDQETR